MVLLACFVASALPASATSAPAAAYRFVADGGPDYWLYTPAGTPPAGGRPMVVYLHGCSQNNETDPPDWAHRWPAELLWVTHKP